jgi:hypothetical protein
MIATGPLSTDTLRSRRKGPVSPTACRRELGYRDGARRQKIRPLPPVPDRAQMLDQDYQDKP